MSLAQDSLGKRSEAVKLAGEALAIYEQIESPVAERVRRTAGGVAGIKWQGQNAVPNILCFMMTSLVFALAASSFRASREAARWGRGRTRDRAGPPNPASV